MALAPHTCARLEAQGFTGLDSTYLDEVAPWLRFSPALCATGMIAGVALRSPLIGVALVVAFTDFCVPSWVYGRMFGASPSR